MEFLRKYFAWIIIGLVLLAEGGGAFLVWNKRAEARTARVRLEELRNTRDDLKRKTRNIDDRIAVHERRRAVARRELADCVLFLWHRGEAIEGLFDAKELAAYTIYPWQQPRSFDVFKVEYQGIYNREVEKLEPVMRKVRATPATLGLADPIGFSQVSVSIGDIYALQKEFWIKKELIDVLARWDALLESVSLGAAAVGRLKADVTPQPGPRLAEPIPFVLSFACEYPHVGSVLEDLFRSPLCLHVGSIENISRAKMPEQPGRGAAAAPGTEAAPDRRMLISVTVLGTIPDIAIGLQSVVFPKATFADKARVLAWVARQERLVDNDLKRYAAPGSPDAKLRPELNVSWIVSEFEKAGKAAKADPAKPVAIEDKLGGERDTRKYTFASLETADDWLRHRFDFERAHLEAVRELWKRVHRVVQAGKADEANKVGFLVTPDALVASFRPAEPSQFDLNQMFEVDLGQGVRAVFGLVVFKPQESRDGVKRATTGTTR